MAQGDIRNRNDFTSNASLLYPVAASATTIKAGEPVTRTLGALNVIPAITATPVVGTHFVVGIANTNSTNTAALAGTVSVTPVDIAKIYTIKTSGTAFANQAAYDAKLGQRVLFTLTGVNYSIATTAPDGATSGLVIMPLDIAAYPGRIAFRFRAGASDLA
jgi:hypothetical protein